MLELREVSRSLGGEQILDRTSLDFPSDSPTAVLGLAPHLREAFLGLLAGADKSKTGRILLNGRDIAHARREKGKIARISSAGLRPTGHRVGKLIGAATAARAGLTNALDSPVKLLDLNQRIRLAIATAVERRASLILIDSPAAGLGLERGLELLCDLKEILGENGAVMVLAASVADEARALDGYVLVVSGGRAVQQGPAAEVFAHPANLTVAVATSFPVLNVLPMIAREDHGVLGDGATFQPPPELRLPEEGACTLAFRPDDTTLERRDERCLRFVARAAAEEALAGRRFLRLSFGAASWLTPLVTEAPRPGALVNLFVERSRLMVFGANGRAVDQTLV